MPVTGTPYPILGYFVRAVIQTTGAPPQPLDTMPEQVEQGEKRQEENTTPKRLPKGVVLGPDGKP